MTTPLAWGILATGNIARTFATGLATAKLGKLLAVGSRAQATAEAFGQQFGVPRRYGSYEALLADPEVQAVYIAPPHPQHLEWAIKAAGAGKHVLCEKPLGVNLAQAQAIVQAAREHNVFLMEAFMYRCAPQTQRLVELLREGVIGQVRVIQASFGYNGARRKKDRVFANEYAGGGILDVGCYPVSMSRLIAGVTAGQNEPAEPAQVKAVGQLHPETGVDSWTAAVLQFGNGVLAQAATGIEVDLENVVRVFGSEGHILVPVPWAPAREGGVSQIIVSRHDDKEPRVVEVPSPQHLYGIEADLVAAHVLRGDKQATFPAMSWDDTLGNMRVLDAWREQIGLKYEFEKKREEGT